MEIAGWALMLAVMGVTFFMAGSAGQLWRYRHNQLKLMRERYSAYEAWGMELQAEETLRKQRAMVGWNGYRKFRVVRKEKESDTVFSFYLEPYDRKPIPDFQPGQFLTFRLRTVPEREPIVRCYSISRAGVEDNQYRISIRRHDKGAGSGYFHDQVNEESILDVGQPSGNFVLDEGKGRPAVFLAGGIGVTPLLAMAEKMVQNHPDQEVWFFYTARSGLDAPLLARLRELKASDNFRLMVSFTQPAESDRAGVDYDRTGHLSLEVIRELLPSSNYEYFLCGPPPMMDDMTGALQKWGVPKSSVHWEMFSADNIRRKSLSSPHVKGATEKKVAFRGAGKSFSWKPEEGSILDQAEASGLSLPSGCRAGNCGTCVAPVVGGSFAYVSRPGYTPEEGCCLLCVAVPVEDIEFA